MIIYSFKRKDIYYYINMMSREDRQLEYARNNIGKYPDSDFRNIMIEDIDDDYGYGKFGSFEVVMMKKNGYVNATKLCQDCGKDYKEWESEERSKELIKLLEDMGQSVIKKSTSEQLTMGIFVPPELIISVAQWCDPAYMFRTTAIVTKSHIQEAKVSQRVN